MVFCMLLCKFIPTSFPAGSYSFPPGTDAHINIFRISLYVICVIWFFFVKTFSNSLTEFDELFLDIDICQSVSDYWCPLLSKCQFFTNQELLLLNMQIASFWENCWSCWIYFVSSWFQILFSIISCCFSLVVSSCKLVPSS